MGLPLRHEVEVNVQCTESEWDNGRLEVFDCMRFLCAMQRRTNAKSFAVVVK